MTIQQITFHSSHADKHLVVFGAVHGNERCGTEAIRRIVAEIEAGDIRLTSGKVTFAPTCNPRAYAANTRFIDRNLNRHFYPKPVHSAYEDGLDPILCALLDSADALLDLHSYQSEGEAFCFLGTTSQAEIDYARALGVADYIYGWADAFGQGATEEQRLASMGTTDYVRRNGRGGIAVTLECGNHHHPDAAEVGYQGICRALMHLGMMDNLLPPVTYAQQRCIRMERVVYKEKAGELTKRWYHAERVRAGEIIARYADGETVYAEQDCVLVLPKAEPDHTIGAEWFYIGVETAFPMA
jgi:predicted deacylase